MTIMLLHCRYLLSRQMAMKVLEKLLMFVTSLYLQ